MSIESETIAKRLDQVRVKSERRERRDRRTHDRRTPTGRVNAASPRRSRMIFVGAVILAAALVGVAASLALEQISGRTQLDSILALEIAVMTIGAILTGLGVIERRLIEIRLELMISNGGDRRTDRRQGDRRGG